MGLLDQIRKRIQEELELLQPSPSLPTPIPEVEPDHQPEVAAPSPPEEAMPIRDVGMKVTALQRGSNLRRSVRDDLKDGQRLRQAIVLREILDKPVALRRRS